MRLIIAGSRDMPQRQAYNLVRHLVDTFHGEPLRVLSGGCRGVDAAGSEWAHDYCVPVVTIPADWNSHGKAAGPMRNQAMVDNADALLVIRYPDSRGSADVLRRARKAGLQVVDVMLPRPVADKRDGGG